MLLIDLALALVAIALLALLTLRVWRQVKALSRTVATAGEQVAQATETLTAAQDQAPRGRATATPVVVERSSGRGPRSRPGPDSRA